MKDVLTIKNTKKKQKEVHVSSNVVEVNKKVLFLKLNIHKTITSN